MAVVDGVGQWTDGVCELCGGALLKSEKTEMASASLLTAWDSDERWMMMARLGNFGEHLVDLRRQGRRWSFIAWRQSEGLRVSTATEVGLPEVVDGD